MSDSRPLIAVTGASQGIGAAIAAVFAREHPCRLALLARNLENLEKVAVACRESGADAHIFSCDATDPESVESAAGRVLGELGTPDVLINNAGRFCGVSFLETTLEQFDELIAANLRSVFLVSRAFLPSMVRRRKGHVFNMSSIAGLNPYPGGTAYCSAKFGVTGLSKVMRREMMEHGIRVTTVYPGATFTPSWQGSGVSEDVMMPAEDVARAFYDAWRLSDRTVVEDLVLRPVGGDPM
ncbi:MAG: SDR family NAD(P)-dependent oxidoreductase [Verrucomicrobia bacterium]|nr:MAG: SDR family NAD(P)-dependent oxidoreductase [Verrucomicrobiota bacterium]